MLSPISNTAAASAVAPAQPVAPARADGAASAAALPAATVEFSDLAQFIATLGLTRKQLLELQGEPDAPAPTAAQLQLLEEAAENLRQSFNQLPPASVDLTPLLADDQGGGTLAERLLDTLRQQGAAAERGEPLANGTLAGIGVTLEPLAPASASDALYVDRQVLAAAYTLDRQATLGLLTRATDAFTALGNALARQASSNIIASTGGTGGTAGVAAGAPPEPSAPQTQLADQALRSAIADAAPPDAAQQDAQALTQAALLRQQQLDAARRALAEQNGNALEETQADRLAATRAAQQRQLHSTAAEDLAATSLADRMESQRLAQQQQQQQQQEQQQHAAAVQAANRPRGPNAADPSTAAAIAAYSAASIAAASGRAPAPPPAGGRIPPVRPVGAVERAHPVDTADGRAAGKQR